MSICVTVIDGVLQQATNGSCELILMSKEQVTQLVDGHNLIGHYSNLTRNCTNTF
ncbi:hypothetical protein FORC22_1567 [Vibrio parahaemolyticus]|nr:hypothetical protein FORC22_1567 [Vibrio parahaemolyticus]